MKSRELQAELLTAAEFAEFGDVIESAETSTSAMNSASFERFDNLVCLDIDKSEGGKVSVSIARCNEPNELPFSFKMMERHPLGSQAFIPLERFVFAVVVAPAGDTLDESRIRAFRTNGRQGINYHRGTWHMPLIALDRGQEFLIIDRIGDNKNCDQVELSALYTLVSE